MPDKIIYKTETCGCGCNGSDPWHKSSYRRNVEKTSETTGFVRLPFSTQPVLVERDSWTNEVSGKTYYGHWHVVRSSIVFDK